MVNPMPQSKFGNLPPISVNLGIYGIRFAHCVFSMDPPDNTIRPYMTTVFFRWLQSTMVHPDQSKG